MTNLKYIRFTNDFFLIFPHDDTSPTCQQLATMLQQSAGMEVISAGQILVDGDTAICSGGSATLNVESLGRNDSEFFINKMFPHAELPPSLRQI